jgi:hypothetical protein
MCISMSDRCIELAENIEHEVLEVVDSVSRGNLEEALARINKVKKILKNELEDDKQIEILRIGISISFSSASEIFVCR